MFQVKDLLFLVLLATPLVDAWFWDQPSTSYRRIQLNSGKCPDNFAYYFTEAVNKYRHKQSLWGVSNDAYLNRYAQNWANYVGSINKVLTRENRSTPLGLVGENFFEVYSANQVGVNYLDLDPEEPVKFWYWNGNSKSPVNQGEDIRFRYFAQLMWPAASKVGIGCALVTPTTNPYALKLFIVAYFTPGPIVDDTPTSSSTTLYLEDNKCPSQVASSFLQQVNYVRGLHSAPPLQTRYDLTMYAQEWALYLAQNNYNKIRGSTQLNWPRPASLEASGIIGESVYELWNSYNPGYFTIDAQSVVKNWYAQVLQYKRSWYQQPQGPPTYDDRFAVRDFTNLVWVGAKQVGFGCKLIRAPNDPNGLKLFIVAYIARNANIDNFSTAAYQNNVRPPTRAADFNRNQELSLSPGFLPVGDQGGFLVNSTTNPEAPLNLSPLIETRPTKSDDGVCGCWV